MSRERDGATLFERDSICMVSPSGSTLQYFQVSTPPFNYTDKSHSRYEQPWHMLCYRFSRTLLLAQHHARSRPNLNQRNHTHFSGAAHARFDQATTLLSSDQSQRDRSHAATPDRRRDGHSSFDHALVDRMRQRRRDRQPTDRHDEYCRRHRFSRMASGSRPLSPCLFRPLWPAITRSTG